MKTLLIFTILFTAPLQANHEATQKLVRAISDSIINALLARNPTISAKTNMGDTALHAAARARDEELCKVLLLRGADRSAENVYGETPHSIAKTTPTTKRIFKQFKQQDRTTIDSTQEEQAEVSPRTKRYRAQAEIISINYDQNLQYAITEIVD